MKKAGLSISQKVLLCAVVVAFIVINIAMYILMTGRLTNNFSSVSQAKMIEVDHYLPFTDSPYLAHIDTDFVLDGDLPVLDGAAALVPVYSAVIDSVYPEGSVTYDGGTFSDDNYYGENFAADSKMQYHNTIRGFNALVDGSIDLFFTAAPSEDQMKYAEEKGVDIVLVPVGKEGFVFFVNAKNPVDDLTVDQIRGIYSGYVRNWSEVGGPVRPINPVTRIAGSGSQSVMDRFMGDNPYGKKDLSSLAGASIGYSFRFYFQGMVDNAGVKMLKVNGVEPSVDSIRSGEYPLVSEFYVAYRKDNSNPALKELIDWILSDEGQSLIESSGYVPII